MSDLTGTPLRTLLFVPGSEPRKLKRAAEFGADAIAIDLEDAVAEDRKDAARALTREALDALPAGTVAFVRVNGLETGRTAEDVAAVACDRLAGVILPKTERAEDLHVLSRLLDEAEQRSGRERGSIRVLALIESARGVAGCVETLRDAPPRVLTALFGLADFCLDVGLDLTQDAPPLAFARGQLIVATRAAGLAPPIDGPFLDLADEAALVADTERARDSGFQGRLSIYPPQVAPVQRVFSDVSPERVARARQVIEAFEAAEREGVGAFQLDGRFVDVPVYVAAKHTLALATAGEERS